MIRDHAIQAELAQDWVGVRKLTSSVHRVVMLPGIAYNETRPDDSYNLPFLLAYAVLDQVLSELITQGTFSCNSWKLGAKMAASRRYLPWQDYATVEVGKEARNRLAHEALLVGKADCLRFVDAVEHELRAWGVI